MNKLKESWPLLILVIALGVACEDMKYEWVNSKECDKEMQKEIFLSCLEHLPKGPISLTASPNDWDEVVDSCEHVAEGIACKYTREYKKIRP